jgi:hypothetical protein
MDNRVKEHLEMPNFFPLSPPRSLGRLSRS